MNNVNMNEVEKAVVCGIELNEKTTIGVWFSGAPAGDILAIMHKKDGELWLTGRLRIYDPLDRHNDAWSGKDAKIPFDKLLFPEDPAKAIEDVRDWLRRMPGFQKMTEFLMEGHTLEDFVRDFTSQSFNHGRTIPRAAGLN